MTKINKNSFRKKSHLKSKNKNKNLTRSMIGISELFKPATAGKSKKGFKTRRNSCKNQQMLMKINNVFSKNKTIKITQTRRARASQSRSNSSKHRNYVKTSFIRHKNGKGSKSKAHSKDLKMSSCRKPKLVPDMSRNMLKIYVSSLITSPNESTKKRQSTCKSTPKKTTYHKKSFTKDFDPGHARSQFTYQQSRSQVTTNTGTMKDTRGS